MSQTKAQLLDTLIASLLPASDSSVDIGSNAVRFANIYGDTLYGDGSNLTGITSTTINSNADNRLITGSGSANTLNGESGLTYDGANLSVTGGFDASSDISIVDTIKHTGDTDTKIRFPTVDTVSLETGAAERLRVDNSNTVFNEAGANIDFRIESDTKTHMFFLDAGNDRIGINTSSPTCMLQINDTATSGDGVTEILKLNGSPNNNNDGIKLQFARVGGAAGSITLQKVADNNTTDMIFGTRSFNTESETMRLTGAGNLGIGTTSPITPLHVKHSTTNGVATFESGDATCLINFKDNSTSSSPSIGTVGNDLKLVTADANRVTVLNTGNVGIGTESPGLPLHVYHATSNGILKVQSGDADVGITLQDSGGEASVRQSSNALTFNTSSSETERMRIDSAGRVLIGTNSTDDYDGFNPSLQVTGGNGDTSSVTISRFSNNGSGANLVLAKSRTGTIGNNAVLQAGDTIASIQFHGNDGSGFHDAAQIRANVASGVGNDDMPADLIFLLNSGTTGVSERMRITSAGKVGIGTDSPINLNSYAGLTLADSNGGIISFLDSSVERGRTGLVGENTFVVQVGPGTSSITFDRLTHDGSNNVNGATELGRFNPNGHFLVGTTSDTTGGTAATEGVAIRKEGHVVSRGTSSSGAKFTAKTTDTGGSLAFRVMLAQTEIGSISMGAGGTAFNTTSDYRRKENVVDLTGAITRLKTLLPKRFNFIGDSSVTRDGFLAHEVTAVPEAIYGTKDQVDSDNNPVYQQIDQSKLVPLLVAAVKELTARVETLEAA